MVSVAENVWKLIILCLIFHLIQGQCINGYSNHVSIGILFSKLWFICNKLWFLGNSTFTYEIWSCIKHVCSFDKHVTFEFFNIYVIFLNSMFMFIFSFGGASLTILTNRLTKGTLSYSILTTQWIHVRGFFMPWDNASWCWAIACRNREF